MATILNFPTQRQSSASRAARYRQSPAFSGQGARIFIFDGIRREEMQAKRSPSQTNEDFASFILSGQDSPQPSPRRNSRQQKR